MSRLNQGKRRKEGWGGEGERWGRSVKVYRKEREKGGSGKEAVRGGRWNKRKEREAEGKM